MRIDAHEHERVTHTMHIGLLDALPSGFFYCQALAHPIVFQNLLSSRLDDNFASLVAVLYFPMAREMLHQTLPPALEALSRQNFSSRHTRQHATRRYCRCSIPLPPRFSRTSRLISNTEMMGCSMLTSGFSILAHFDFKIEHATLSLAPANACFTLPPPRHCSPFL